MSNNELDTPDGSRHPARERAHPVREHLRQSTHASHVRLNAHPLLCDLTRPGLRLDRYGRVLEAYWHLYGHVESLILDVLPRIGAGFDYAPRRKLPWLAQDLACLGVTPAPFPRLPRPPWRDIAVTRRGELAGILYAIEGSSLGGQVISRYLARHHGLDHDSGARFYHGYGDATPARWEQFCAWLETLPGGHELDCARAMARRFFDCIEATLDAYV